VGLADRLLSLLLLAMFSAFAVLSVRDGEALLALLAGVTLGVMLSTYLVLFVRWREKNRRTGPQQNPR
jgi:hypothetical protein